MSDPTLQAQIDAAKAYEALMVPALFGQWASKVADAAQIRPGQRVLDVWRAALESWPAKPRHAPDPAVSLPAWTPALACWK